ncbi:hypothetical protein SDC9_190443 [bioreactor metagenome]|uniref:Uncharacterized protein n=1 Tax=bioreactor metagenome TaxID=1076179 RepID=A0A645HV02_9ZZZZ
MRFEFPKAYTEAPQNEGLLFILIRQVFSIESGLNDIGNGEDANKNDYDVKPGEQLEIPEGKTGKTIERRHSHHRKGHAEKTAQEPFEKGFA